MVGQQEKFGVQVSSALSCRLGGGGIFLLTTPLPAGLGFPIQTPGTALAILQSMWQVEVPPMKRVLDLLPIPCNVSSLLITGMRVTLGSSGGEDAAASGLLERSNIEGDVGVQILQPCQAKVGLRAGITGGALAWAALPVPQKIPSRCSQEWWAQTWPSSGAGNHCMA